MPRKELRSTIRTANLENRHGYITVKWKIDFDTDENKDTRCDNCNYKMGGIHYYRLDDGREIKICQRCNETKVHNPNSNDPRFNRLINVFKND